MTTIGFISYHPEELEFNIQIGESLKRKSDFDLSVIYLTRSKVFTDLLDIKIDETVYFVEDRAENCDGPDWSFRALKHQYDIDNIQSFVFSDRYYEANASYDRRKQMVSNHFYVWENILQSHDIDCIISAGGGEYVRRCGYYAAMNNDVEFYFVGRGYPIAKSPRILLYSDEKYSTPDRQIESVDTTLSKETKEDLTQFEDREIGYFEEAKETTLAEPHEIRKFFDAVRDNIYIQSSSDSNFKRTPLSTVGERISQKASYRKMSSIYRTPPFDDDYLLFPLHQPRDAQITVGEPYFFESQLDLARLISNNLPLPYKLYTKEHPAGIGDYSREKLKQISLRTNIEVLDPKIHPRKLIEDSEAIITIRSTMGWEGILLGKSVVCLGNPIYSDLGLTVDVDSWSELEKTIVKAMGNDGPERDDILEFMEYFRSISERGQTINVSTDKNRERLVAAIQNQLSSS